MAFLFGLVGCGEVHPSEHVDGSISDGSGADAAGPASGPVTVTFYYVAPVADAHVIVHDPQGAVVAEGLTDPSGRKRFDDVPRGSTLTVAKSLGNAPRVYTVVGVQPGDEIVLGERGENSTSATITVSASGITADHFALSPGCSVSYWNGQSFGVSADSSCASTSTTWNIVAVAYNAANAPLSYSVKANVSGGSTVVLSNWRTDFGTFAINWSNPPAGATTTTGSFNIRYPLADPGLVQSTAASGTFSYRYPQGAASVHEYTLEATGSGIRSTLFRRIAPTSSVTIDLGATLLPFVTNVAVGLTDKTRPVFSWLSGGTTGVDMVHILASWDGPGYYEWHVYASPELQSPYQLPQIPASWGNALQPPTSSGWTFGGSVSLSDDESKAGWNDVRSAPGSYTANRSSGASYSASF